MANRMDVESQVGLAAALDTEWLDVALIDPELVHDAALWAPVGEGAMDVLAAHPWVHQMVEVAVVSTRVHVRATVATRPDLGAEVYALLGSDLHPAVRSRIAGNHAAPGAVVDRLTRDEDLSVRAAAERELARRHPALHVLGAA
ncbi:MAG TPA: hypothetical protein VIY72_08920 [Acidimicrobiales bacterium]